MTLCSSFAKIFRSDASTAGLVHVCDWSDAACSFPFRVHVQPFIWKNFADLPTLRGAQCRLLPDDGGDKLQQAGMENEFMNEYSTRHNCGQKKKFSLEW